MKFENFYDGVWIGFLLVTIYPGWPKELFILGGLWFIGSCFCAWVDRKREEKK